MVHSLFISKNLIGDALNISPAWRAWWIDRRQSAYEIDLLTDLNQVAPLYSAMGVPANVITDVSRLRSKYDFVFRFDVNVAFRLGSSNNIHIAQAYARMLGVKISTLRPTCLLDNSAYRGLDVASGSVLVSPFSASCLSTRGQAPNKMLRWDAWVPVIQYLKTLGRHIYVLGSSTDKEIPDFGLASSQFLLGTHSLLEVARLMRDRASIVVTVDNGIAHLAASQELPTFLFYPACLSMEWIVPRGNPYCVPFQLDPGSCSVSDVLQAVKWAVPHLLRVRE